jgi:hypothetical protein
MGARLYKRGEVWWCWGYDENGARWHASTHQREVQAAKIVALKLEKELAIPKAHRARSLTLKQVLDLKLKALERGVETGKRSPNTIEIHCQKSAHLLRIFGADRVVSSISLEDINKYMDTRLAEAYNGRNIGIHTIQKEIRALTESLHVAKRLQLYQKNPADLWPEEIKRRV